MVREKDLEVVSDMFHVFLHSVRTVWALAMFFYRTLHRVLNFFL